MKSEPIFAILASEPRFLTIRERRWPTPLEANYDSCPNGLTGRKDNIIKITIFGKVRRKGTSKKTGNPYDFVELHMAVPKRDVIGESAERKIVDASFCDFDKLALGVYNADFDTDGNILTLTHIQK